MSNHPLIQPHIHSPTLKHSCVSQLPKCTSLTYPYSHLLISHLYHLIYLTLCIIGFNLTDGPFVTYLLCLHTETVVPIKHLDMWIFASKQMMFISIIHVLPTLPDKHLVLMKTSLNKVIFCTFCWPFGILNHQIR